MENIWLILIMIVIVLIALIFGLKKKRKDRKKLFKKPPGDYPEPKEVKSEFDVKD